MSQSATGALDICTNDDGLSTAQTEARHEGNYLLRQLGGARLR